MQNKKKKLEYFIFTHIFTISSNFLQWIWIIPWYSFHSLYGKESYMKSISFVYLKRF